MAVLRLLAQEGECAGFAPRQTVARFSLLRVGDPTSIGVMAVCARETSEFSDINDLMAGSNSFKFSAQIILCQQVTDFGQKICDDFAGIMRNRGAIIMN